MEDIEKEPRLSDLSTQWTMLFQAHHGTPEEVGDALRLMMLRYSGAVHRYLLKTVGDPEEVKELDQEFGVTPRIGRICTLSRDAETELALKTRLCVFAC